MSFLTFVKRAVAPDAPANGKSRFYVDGNDEPNIITAQGVVKPLTGIFGAQYGYSKNINQSNTTSTSFQSYLTLPFSNLVPTASYKLEVFFVWGYANAGRDFRARFTVNGVPIGEEFRQEPKDGGSDQRHWAVAFDVLTGQEIIDAGLATSGFIGLDFASSQSGEQARMYRAILEIKRVA